MSHPDALPDLFLDRSLGRIRVPELLRAGGLRLTTLAEHYGVPRDERVADAEWLTLAGQRWHRASSGGHQRDKTAGQGHDPVVAERLRAHF